jgi:hypothetical protein
MFNLYQYNDRILSKTGGRYWYKELGIWDQGMGIRREGNKAARHRGIKDQGLRRKAIRQQGDKARREDDTQLVLSVHSYLSSKIRIIFIPLHLRSSHPGGVGDEQNLDWGLGGKVTV